MNQISIGRFIAQERKKKGYTQKQLSDILNISDKTISKWETGKGFPEISLIMPLCNALDINVNELLSGEKIGKEDYVMKAEKNMVDLVMQAKESKKKIILTSVIIIITLVSSITMFLLADTLQMPQSLRILLIALGCVIMSLGIMVSCVLDKEAGAYECPHCKHRFVPSMGQYVFGMHTLTRRMLTCPKCKKRSMCKRVLTK